MTSFQQDFPILQQGGVYLNHAAMSPWPASARDAIIQFAEENTLAGARHYTHWMAKEKALHDKLAKLIDAPSGQDIALCKNTSEGLSLIANALPWVKVMKLSYPMLNSPPIACLGSCRSRKVFEFMRLHWIKVNLKNA